MRTRENQMHLLVLFMLIEFLPSQSLTKKAGSFTSLSFYERYNR
jgi:hypothetical protein